MDDRRDFSDYYPGVGPGVTASSASGYDAAARADIAAVKAAVDGIEEIPASYKAKDVRAKVNETLGAIKSALAVLTLCSAIQCEAGTTYDELNNDDVVALQSDVDAAVADKASTGQVAVVRAAADAANATNAILAGQISALQNFDSTNRTTRLWNSTNTTLLTDQDLNKYQIVTSTNQTSGYVVTSADSSHVSVGDYYIFDSFATNYVPADGPVPAYTITNVYYYKSESATALQYHYDIFNGASWEIATGVAGGLTDWTMPAGYGAETLFLADQGPNDYASLTATNPAPIITVSTNIIDRAVTTNGTIIIIGNLYSSGGTVTAEIARVGSEIITNYFLSPDGYYTKAESEARYLSATPGWWWQGSQVIECTNAITTNLTGYAVVTNGVIALVPYTTSKHNVTGSVEFVSSSRYAVDVLATAYEAVKDDPSKPVEIMGHDYEWTRTSNTSLLYRAWIDPSVAAVNSYYYYALSNALLRTYDRADMAPNTYINDAAGIKARVDNATGSDPRAPVNYATMVAYFESRMEEVAKSAWNYTPAGNETPDANICTIDEPLVLQGQMSYLQSGDYYCYSYSGGDWYSSTTGSVLRIGPSGSVSFEITSTNRMLNVIGMDVDREVNLVTLDISTNWVVSTPVIMRTRDLENPQWLYCPAQTMTNHTSYWRGTCPVVYDRCYFKVVDPAGENLIRSYNRHVFLAGLTIGTNTFSTLDELKTILEALP